jgi:hypothetical protein
MCNREPIEGLSVGTVARDGNCPLFPLNIQRTYYWHLVVFVCERINRWMDVWMD